MRTLKSGVYFVKFKDIDKFFQDVEKNGWKHNFDKPQKNIHETLIALDKEDETIKQSVIPFALNQEKKTELDTGSTEYVWNRKWKKT